MALPNTRMVPNGWSAHHRASIESAMTAIVTVEHPSTAGPGKWNPVTGDVSTGAPAEVYSGLARIQALSNRNASLTDAADQLVASSDYLIQVPATTIDIRVGEHAATVTVTACPDDAGIVGRRFTVHDVLHGSQAWARDLLCRDDLTANNP